MTEWIKRLQGYVKIRVWGFAPQRFINLCSKKGILLWDIEKQNDIYTMCISLKAFYQLRGIARKTKVRVVISERYGLPFLMPLMFRRKAFLLGVLLSVLFWCISSLHVWEIQVSGNYQVTDDVFSQFLEQQGVRTGMKKSDLDIAEVEKKIRRNFPQIVWTSGRLDGTRLVIDLKENDTPVVMELQDPAGGGKDLVAEYDGIITEMIVRSGVPKVSAGTEVTKGDILVEGKIPIYAEDGTVREYHLVTADADIFMEHPQTFQIYLPADYIKKQYTGRIKREYFFQIENRSFKTCKKIPFLQYDSIMNTQTIKVLEQWKYPCVIGRITYREYQKTEYVYTMEEAKNILQKKIMGFLESLDEKGVQIISKDVKIETKCAGWMVHGTLIVKERTGTLTDSAVEDVADSETEASGRNEE